MKRREDERMNVDRTRGNTLVKPDRNLQRRSNFYEILLQQIVENRIQLLPDVLDQHRTAHRYAILEVIPEVLVPEESQLLSGQRIGFQTARIRPRIFIDTIFENRDQRFTCKSNSFSLFLIQVLPCS